MRHGNIVMKEIKKINIKGSCVWLTPLEM